MSQRNQGRSDWDERLEDCSLRLSDRPMAYDFICYEEDYNIPNFCVGGKRERAYDFRNGRTTQLGKLDGCGIYDEDRKYTR